MTGYCIVDVCGTLVKDDTTIGLLRWHFARHRRWRLLLLSSVTARWSPLRLLVAVMEKVTGRHLLKHGLVRLLKGDAIAEVEQSAAGYADWLLSSRRVEHVTALLEGSKARVEGLVLASASLEPVIAALASRLGARFVASSLSTANGWHLGRYARDLTGQKIAALDELLPADWKKHAVIGISDNLTDRTLLQTVQKPYVVLHSHGHRARWGDIRAEYLSAC